MCSSFNENYLKGRNSEMTFEDFVIIIVYVSLCLLYYISLSDKYMTHALRKIFIQLILLAIKTNNKTFIIKL